MRRVTLFVNGTCKNGKVVAVYGTLSDLLSVASNKLGIKASCLYNGKGGLIDDIALIRDDDVLYVSEGDPFIDPQNEAKITSDPLAAHTDWLTLNIGGRLFTTTRSTLVSKEPESMLAHMFREKDVWGNKQDEHGAYLIDRSPEYFEPILNYLRHGQLIINEGINIRELAATRGPLSYFPQRVCPFSFGNTDQVRAPLSGTQFQWRRSVPT
uniref:Potassium channel tetramerization domain containing 9a n=1 Tax=Astatotilapia calliptera TaxID=8154 RepID=A0A3P8Q3U5_ASTCA